ncbi:serine/arginine repetitive matrix protein 2 [Streptomyces botrytidirepellens]|uniref:Serine/arginine repetitive matrix protein 2 n=1 Tax=Streptomyces botrytidirepellens TaxID=2486417 RepID=A0A3M8TDT9_9ACTN|nr:serine/arginine repetitive matrix protein 2 [Streptomyces botrytidirepellens]RNF90096.1 serine/arginine repetitive matrix protein 2 [Streptomyces botrytidirepellens]
MSDGGSEPGAETRRVVQAVAVTVFLTAGIAFSGWVAFGGDGTTRHQAGPLPWDRATPTPSATADATAPGDVYPAPETGAPTGLPSGLPSASPSGLPSAYPSGSPDASASAVPSLTGSAPPAGFSTERDPEGFDIAVPEGWRRTVEGPSVFYTSPDDSTMIQVFELHGPESTPYESAQEAERLASRNRGYEQITLAQLGAAAMDPAQLEYTYQSKESGARRILDRRFAAQNGTMYAVLIIGSADDRAEEQSLHDTVLETFCPTAYCTAS